MKYIIREKNIGIICNALRQLSFNIQFLNMPLSQAFLNISKTEKNTVGEMFFHISQEINEGKSELYTLWNDALDFYSEELLLKNDEKQIISDFSKRLGTGDKNNEINNIECTVLRLKSVEEEAVNERRSNVKVFRGLGALTGIFIVILLL